MKSITEKDIINLNKLERWGLFFKIADRREKQEILNKLKREEEGIMEASKTLNRISTDLEMQLYQIREEILETDRITSLEDAEERGRAEGIIETARKFKQNNVSVDIIMKSTGLSEEEIKKL